MDVGYAIIFALTLLALGEVLASRIPLGSRLGWAVAIVLLPLLGSAAWFVWTRAVLPGATSTATSTQGNRPE